MNTRIVASALALSLACLSLTAPAQAQTAEPAAASARPEISKYARAFTGHQGVQVLTLRVGPRDAKETIVQIVGIDHDWDGKLQKLRTVLVRDEERLVLVDADDQERVVLNLDNRGHGYLHLPGVAAPIAVGYSKDLSDQVNPEHFLTAYLQQATP